jgi:dTDP-4-dehydrorhamnose 3,5-epimerase
MSEPAVKHLKTFLDDRGYLYEILRADDPEYVKFGQAYISTTTPGTIKAFHRHFHKTDHIACVAGQVKLVVVRENINKGDPPFTVFEYHLSPISPKLVTIPPGLWHGWQSVGSVEAVLLSITTEVHDSNNKDEERVPAIDNPFGYVWGVKHG